MVFTGCSSLVSLTGFSVEETGNTEKNNSLTKAMIHHSDSKPPDKSVLIGNQQEVATGADQSKLAEAKQMLHEIHMYFEIGFIFQKDSWFDELSDSESPGWNLWEQPGIFNQSELIGAGNNQIGGSTYLQSLADIKEVFTHETLLQDISLIQQLIEYAVENRDLRGLFYAHQVLHDLDYWVLNYPMKISALSLLLASHGGCVPLPANLAMGPQAPPDLAGIKIYFGATKTLAGASLLEIEELVSSK